MYTYMYMYIYMYLFQRVAKRACGVSVSQDWCGRVCTELVSRLSWRWATHSCRSARCMMATRRHARAPICCWVTHTHHAHKHKQTHTRPHTRKNIHTHAHAHTHAHTHT